MNGKNLTQISMKSATTVTFGDKIWVGVHILSHIIVKNGKNMFLKNDKSLNTMPCSFPSSDGIYTYKKRDTEWGPIRAHCIFTILLKIAVSKSGQFSCQLE